MIAVNDGILLRNHIPRILKKHFRGKPYYVDLLDLFNEVACLFIGYRSRPIGFRHNLLLCIGMNLVYPGRISNNFRTNDRLNYYN